jgi:hypothetical protein
VVSTLGKNVKITAPESARELARATFETALGAKRVAPTEKMDVFQLDGSNIGFEYSADALTAAQMRISVWLEFAVENVEQTSERLGALGIERLDYRDKEHPYFIGPAGVVFRLTRLT